MPRRLVKATWLKVRVEATQIRYRPRLAKYAIQLCATAVKLSSKEPRVFVCLVLETELRVFLMALRLQFPKEFSQGWAKQS